MNPSPASEDRPKKQHRPSRLVFLIVLTTVVSLSVSAYLLLTPTGKKQLTQVTSPVKPTVTLKTETKNPFNKDTQFVNPFETYKSPFYSLKQKAKNEQPLAFT